MPTLTRSIERSIAPIAVHQRPRIDSIDMLRGLLMVVIIVAHAEATLDPTYCDQLWERLLQWCLQLGTPGFVVTSGLLLGYFAVVRNDLKPILRKYASRARVLLLVAHPLIAVAQFGPLHQSSDRTFLDFVLDRWHITDSLAILFLVLAPFLKDLTLRVRCLLGLSMLLATPLIRLAVPGEGLSTSALVLKEALVGVDLTGPHVLVSVYPLLPLAGAFLIGSMVGDRYARLSLQGDSRRMAMQLLRLAVPLLASSGGLVLVWFLLRQGTLGFTSSLIVELLYPDRFFSLFPAFLAIVFLCLATLILRAESGRTRVERYLEAMGKASLTVYVVQYFLVQTLPWLIGRWHHTRLLESLVIVVLALPPLYFVAMSWNARVKKA